MPPHARSYLDGDSRVPFDLPEDVVQPSTESEQTLEQAQDGERLALKKPDPPGETAEMAHPCGDVRIVQDLPVILDDFDRKRDRGHDGAGKLLVIPGGRVHQAD